MAQLVISNMTLLLLDLAHWLELPNWIFFLAFSTTLTQGNSIMQILWAFEGFFFGKKLKAKSYLISNDYHLG